MLWLFTFTLLIPLNLSLSNKCNEKLEGITKKWYTLISTEPIETENALDTLKDAYRIRINDQNIPKLCKGAIKDLNTLYELDISGNKIREIEEGAFVGVGDLRYLRIHDNKLKHIKTGLFNKLPIVFLSLQCNEIELIDATAFDDMANLRSLNLSNNTLASVNSDWFKNTPNIVQLSLEYNLITDLSAHNFKNLHGKTAGDDITTWLNIDLSNNRIATIDPKAFDDIGELGILSLDHNEITALHEDTFKNVQGINWVNFMFNKISCLPTHIDNILKAAATFLENNPLNCTCLESLIPKLKLKELVNRVDIEANVIKCQLADMQNIVSDTKQ